MNDKWRDRLKDLLDEGNAPHNTAAALHARERRAPSETGQSQKGASYGTDKTDKTPSSAERLGFVATWAREFGYVAIHDPTTGEWHDIATREAPGWAVGEARRRRGLYKDGNREAYRLTSREMEEIWEAEHPPPIEDLGIVEEHPLPD